MKHIKNIQNHIEKLHILFKDINITNKTKLIFILIGIIMIIGIYSYITLIKKKYMKEIVLDKILKYYKKNENYISFRNIGENHLNGLFSQKYGLVFIKVCAEKKKIIGNTKNNTVFTKEKGFLQKNDELYWKDTINSIKENYINRCFKNGLGRIQIKYFEVYLHAKLKINNDDEECYITDLKNIHKMISKNCEKIEYNYKIKYYDILKEV